MQKDISKSAEEDLHVIISTDEAMQIKGVCRGTIRNWVNSGQIDSEMVGRVLKVVDNERFREIKTQQRKEKRLTFDPGKIKDDEIMTVTQAAKLFGLSRQAIWNAINRGDLRTVKAGKQCLIVGREWQGELMTLRQAAIEKGVQYLTMIKWVGKQWVDSILLNRSRFIYRNEKFEAAGNRKSHTMHDEIRQNQERIAQLEKKLAGEKEKKTGLSITEKKKILSRQKDLISR